MSNNTPDPAFWQRVDAIVNVANNQINPAHPNDVGASAMYAVARFNAFILAKTTGSPENMKAEKERALDYFTGQFRLMLDANLDDFTVNFEKYMAPESK
ncbi:MAG: DUF3144 domain-containing protein [Cytophagaceae bacterium]|nr:MAG: DUF3144 domain-containing protein [Cytophagaceae bacterium]